jgi:hypothetical protein
MKWNERGFILGAAGPVSERETGKSFLSCFLPPRGEEIFFSFSSSPCLLLEKVRKSMVGVICMAGH